MRAISERRPEIKFEKRELGPGNRKPVFAYRLVGPFLRLDFFCFFSFRNFLLYSMDLSCTAATK